MTKKTAHLFWAVAHSSLPLDLPPKKIGEHRNRRNLYDPKEQSYVKKLHNIAYCQVPSEFVTICLIAIKRTLLDYHKTYICVINKRIDND